MSGRPDIELVIRNRAGAVIACALVDAGDDEVATTRWSLHTNGYVVGWRNGRVVRLHRHLLGLNVGDPREVDHINGDRLDNRRCNLRVVDRAQNAQNKPSLGGSSRHRNVYWCPARGLWEVRVKRDGRSHFIGRFKSEADAARAAVAARGDLFTHSVERS